MKALRNPETNMKRPVHWLAIGVMALSLGVTGCKHGLQKTTRIDGTGPGSIRDEKPEVLGPGNATPPDRGPGNGAIVQPNDDGLKAGPGHPGWPENRTEFARPDVLQRTGSQQTPVSA